MNLRYVLGTLISLPLLPVLYVQSKQIRHRVPPLPAAIDPAGTSGEYSDTRQLLVIGESTMAGLGVDKHCHGFAGTLAQELSTNWSVSIEWRVYAQSGFTARQVTERILPRIQESQADLIVVGLGGNDSFQLNSPARWRRQIRRLSRQLRQRFPEAAIFFTHMPPVKEFPAFTPLAQFIIGNLTEMLGAEIPRAIREIERVYYPNQILRPDEWKERLGVEPDAFFSDGVHPSALTYQTWAREMADFIVDQLD